MKQKIEPIEQEIVHYTMTRLNHFKRINYRCLTELVDKKFSIIYSRTLLQKHLIKTKKIELKRGYLTLVN